MIFYHPRKTADKVGSAARKRITAKYFWRLFLSEADIRFGICMLINQWFNRFYTPCGCITMHKLLCCDWHNFITLHTVGRIKKSLARTPSLSTLKQAEWMSKMNECKTQPVSNKGKNNTFYVRRPVRASQKNLKIDLSSTLAEFLIKKWAYRKKEYYTSRPLKN